MNHTLTLDPEDLLFDFEDTAFIYFHTAVPNYAFALDLNRLYGFSFGRTDDITLGGTAWPLFAYTDTAMHLRYYIVEKPPSAADDTPTWDPGDKLLIVRGANADEAANRIDEDFNAPLSDTDPTRTEIIQYYQQAFATVSLIQFSDTEIDTANLPRRRKGAVRANMADFFARILDEIEKV